MYVHEVTDDPLEFVNLIGSRAQRITHSRDAAEGGSYSPQRLVIPELERDAGRDWRYVFLAISRLGSWDLGQKCTHTSGSSRILILPTIQILTA
jgi:hypothetical protein